MGQFGGGRRNLGAGQQEVFLELRERPLGHGGAGNQEIVALCRQLFLVGAKQFSKPAFGAVAVDGIAHGGRGGDDAGTWQRARCERIGGRGSPPSSKGSGVKTTPLGPDNTNFVLAAEMLLRAKTHGPRRCRARPEAARTQTTVRRLRPLRRRARMTLRPPGVAIRAR